ncbi:hypothetical protein UFOVP1288_74 [uncultured Caudovirales phage]|uniref:Uncharacterized protein n=1 Tax=uncultured Caudovirales phage TaxID=2100421 RepID=A0A6J5S913_9CAUD|nr:hypothetical protein UFOVP1195_74 [uncultured Caudovirales phage]CAB4196292.1 hypothetical protein UFOVP1288_74 [uncultured Caudovirales phage]CAB4205212.1 hypothetical protein UFOVP1409_74 [uncultured Caudovirales phage]
MTVTRIEPTRKFPTPYDNSDEHSPTLIEEITVAANTAELQHALGAPLDIEQLDPVKASTLFNDALRGAPVKDRGVSNHAMAYAAAAFLRTYGQNVAFDAVQVRTAITTKLLEIANCGDTKHELRALELLGKHSDVGLFTERSEITINYKTPEDLEDAIKERVKRLLNADVIDITPINMDLDEEFGIAKPLNGPKPQTAWDVLDETL